MKRIAILTSGGDAPGMNACIRAVTKIALDSGIEVVGVLRGYRGLIEDEFINITRAGVGNILQTGGTVLFTSRCQEFKEKAAQKKAAENLARHGVDGLVVIGGNGSFAGALALSKLGVKVACIPGTIDNDLFYTDLTLGFDTAVNTITGLINNIRDTAMSHERPSIIEVMGAECGDIALNVGAAVGAEIVLVPEIKVSKDDVCAALKKCKELGKNSCLVIVNEKTFDANDLSAYINHKLGIGSRPLVVGHIQRGGSPSAVDRILALRFASKAVELLKKNLSGAVGIVKDEIIAVSIADALSAKHKFNKNLYTLNNIVGGKCI